MYEMLVAKKVWFIKMISKPLKSNLPSYVRKLWAFINDSFNVVSESGPNGTTKHGSTQGQIVGIRTQPKLPSSPDEQATNAHTTRDSRGQAITTIVFITYYYLLQTIQLI